MQSFLSESDSSFFAVTNHVNQHSYTLILVYILHYFCNMNLWRNSYQNDELLVCISRLLLIMFYLLCYFQGYVKMFVLWHAHLSVFEVIALFENQLIFLSQLQRVSGTHFEKKLHTAIHYKWPQFLENSVLCSVNYYSSVSLKIQKWGPRFIIYMRSVIFICHTCGKYFSQLSD